MQRSVHVPLLMVCVAFGMVASVGNAAGGEHSYVGSKKCKMCHIKEWKSWAETRMAGAFDVLRAGESVDRKKAAGLDPDRDDTSDETCVPCHTTGYGEPGGFVDVETTPHLASVGCEMCHGAGGTYIEDRYMSMKNKRYKKEKIVAVGMVDEVTVSLCSNCHNTDSPFVGDDHVFDFEENKDKGTHEKFPMKYTH